jgi:hypothetical protein
MKKMFFIISLVLFSMFSAGCDLLEKTSEPITPPVSSSTDLIKQVNDLFQEKVVTDGQVGKVFLVYGKNQQAPAAPSKAPADENLTTVSDIDDINEWHFLAAVVDENDTDLTKSQSLYTLCYNGVAKEFNPDMVTEFKAFDMAKVKATTDLNAVVEFVDLANVELDVMDAWDLSMEPNGFNSFMLYQTKTQPNTEAIPANFAFMLADISTAVLVCTENNTVSVKKETEEFKMVKNFFDKIIELIVKLPNGDYDFDPARSQE